MQSIYKINKIYEKDLSIEFTINDGIFDNDGDFFIIQHPTSIQNLQSFLTYTDDIDADIDSNNYFSKEIRWTFDTVNWTSWYNINDTISSFPNPNNSTNVWIQLKYTWNTNNASSAILRSVNITGTRYISEVFEPYLIKSNNPVFFTNADTFKVFSVDSFNIYTVGNIPLDNVDVQFRYTQTQGRSWSNWYKLMNDNLKSIKFDPIRFCNFQFGFNNTNDYDIQLYDLELNGKFQNITAAYATTSRLGLKTQCIPLLTESVPELPCDTDCIACEDNSITGINLNVGTDGKTCCVSCSQSISPWSNITGNSCADDTCKDSIVNMNSRAVYGVRASLNEYLNDRLSSRVGYTMTYALCDPDRKGTDPILHEHQLHNVLMIKDIKVIVPDGQFPNNDITLSGLDLDLIQTFEVHITKKEFKDTFGVEFRPGNKDIVYFCDINQMWEVNQMIPARRGYNAETYWRVLLKKYNDRKSRKFVNPEDKNIIDSLTKMNTLDELFGIQQNAEFTKTSKNVNIEIENTAQLNNHKTMNNLIKSLHNSVNFSSDNVYNASLTLSDSQYIMPLTSKDLKLVTYNNVDRIVKKGDNRGLSLWFNTESYDPTYEFKLFNNYDSINNKGYMLKIYDGKLTFTINSNSYDLNISSFIASDTWYCLFVNLYQQQNELEICVYKRQSETAQTDSKLILSGKNIWTIDPIEFEHSEDMYLGGVDLHTNNTTGNVKKFYIANVRVYNQNLPKNKRNIVLNELVPNDTHLTLLCDNSEKPFYLPDYGNI